MTEATAATARLTFVLFLCGQTLSAMGDSFTSVSMPLLLLERGATIAQVTDIHSIALVTSLVGMLFVGRTVDRFDRRRLLIVSDLIQAAGVALVPIAESMHALTTGVVVVARAISAVGGSIFAVGFVPFIGDLVPPASLMRTNAAVNTGASIATVVGPVLAGICCARFGAVFSFGIDSLTFLASAVSLSLLRPVNAVAAHERVGTSSSSLRGIVDGASEIARNVHIRWFLGLGTVQNFAGIASVSMFIVHLRETLRAGDEVVGRIASLVALGGIVGAVLAPVGYRRLGPVVTLFVLGMMQAAALGSAVFTNSILADAIAGFVFLAGRIGTITIGMTLRQHFVRPALLGRVVAIFAVAITACGAVGTVIAGRTAVRFGIPQTMTAFGILIAVCTIVVVLKAPNDFGGTEEPATVGC